MPVRENGALGALVVLFLFPVSKLHARAGAFRTMADPYEIVRAEVQRQLASGGGLVVRWRNAPPAGKDAAAAAVRKLLSEVEVDLQDLEETISIASTPAESRARNAFLQDSLRTCREMREELDRSSSSTPSRRAGKGGSSRAELLRSDNGRAGAPSDAHAYSAPARRDAPLEAVMQQQMMTQQEEMQAQDVELGNLSVAVSRLDKMGRTINTELRQQGAMLDDLDHEVDEAGAQMGGAMATMQKMLKSSDRGKFCAILVLTAVLIVLTMLVFS